MKRILLFIAAAVGVVLIASYFNAPSDKELQRARILQDSIAKAKIAKAEPSHPDRGQLLLDSLNQVYKKYNFDNFCVLKSDLDSVFLTADFMASIVVGKDDYGPRHSALRTKIEKDRRAAYLKRNGLNKSQVEKDIIKLAVMYPNPCDSYSKHRYENDKEYIRNSHSLQLHIETAIKYQ